MTGGPTIVRPDAAPDPDRAYLDDVLKRHTRIPHYADEFWEILRGFKRDGDYTPGTVNPSFRSFWAGQDHVEGVLEWMLSVARQELLIAMYAFYQPQLAEIVQRKCEDPHVFVQMTLDRSMMMGKRAKEILQMFSHDKFGTTISIGGSRHGAIQHIKGFTVDGIVGAGGSTNWSPGGIGKQENELIVFFDPQACTERRAEWAKVHDWQLARMTDKDILGAV